MDPQALLQQLRDVHAPPPVGWWPPAPGWWVLCALILVSLAYLAYRFWRARRARAWKKHALTQFTRLSQQYQSTGSAETLTEIIMLIKLSLARAKQSEHYLSLSGEDWRCCLEHEFELDEVALDTLTQGHYQEHCALLSDQTLKRLRKGLGRLNHE